MKTSKIILFSYIGLLAMAFLAFVIFIVNVDHKFKSQESKVKTLTKELPAFKYICVERQSVQLKNDDKTYISALIEQDSDLKEITFKSSGDTLFINHTDGYLNLVIHLKDISELNLINLNANISVSDLVLDTLNYQATGTGQISGFRNSTIGTVNAGLSGSQFNAYDGAISQINLKAENSKVNIRKKLDSFIAQISTNSDVRIGNCYKINFEKDDSSKFYCYP